jgi:16S rRNA (uracil1498-N3)-methyltransferase
LARRRFFVDEVRGGAAELRGEDARHLSRVLRAEAGQRYEISDGRGAWLAEIEDARGDCVRFRALEPVETPQPAVHITLCAALVKFDRFEWMVEKATELGVERILPVETARTEKGLFEASARRRARWEKIARESGQQSRRLRAPEILPAVRFADCLRSQATDLRYFLEEDTAPPLLRVLPTARAAAAEAALMIGPEGGWTDREREAAAAAGWLPVSLGPHVLRAETAAAAAVAILVNAWQ